MLKLTKKQLKARERIEAWIKGEPFRQTQRDKWAVPELSREQVLETYVPLYIQDGGKYFTPLETAQAAFRDISFRPGLSVLEPCAGIGHLLAADEAISECRVTCYELDRECVGVGRRLFPWAEWHHANPFEHASSLEGRFDLVLCNPPYRTTWGMSSAESFSQTRTTKSEYHFLELAARCLIPGGQAVFIAPYNFWDNRPKALVSWCDRHLELVTSFGPLPGEFQFTQISVHAFHFERPDNAVRVEDLPAPQAHEEGTEPSQLSLFG